jgi:phosphoglycolate phosphatase
VSAEAVLFDFDGPICSVFHGYPAPAITEELRQLAGNIRPDLQNVLEKPTSPHELLLAAASDMQLAAELECALQTAEMTAVETALPTPGATESLAACRERGKLVAIVSNNYAEAVNTYLSRTGLAHLVMHVEGRDTTDPTLMKPSPHLIERAAGALGVRATDCLFIGDQPSDMLAGREANCRTIGYANKPGKAAALTVAGAEVVVDTMRQLSASFR